MAAPFAARPGESARPANRQDLSGLPDAELIFRYRAGEAAAGGELWRRHLTAALATARTATDRVDPEDVAAEAFLAVLHAIRGGSGPRHAFRPYLLTAVRNTAVRMGQKAARETPLSTEHESLYIADDALDAAEDRAALGTVFATLPVRWQEVLWRLEVQGLTTVRVGQLMGLNPSAVTSLAYRARRGLRTALETASTEPEDSEPSHAPADRLEDSQAA